MKVAVIILALSVSCSATTRYIAQTAGTFTGGTACNGQTAITPATWNATSEVGDDVSWVCGTINGSAGSNVLTFGWSGTSGHPIVLNFDSNGIIQDPYCGTGAGACIVLSGHNFITINGENTGNATGGTTWTTGLVRSYANGQSGTSICPGTTGGAPPWTASCANSVTNVTMIEAIGSSNIIIENLGPCVGAVMNNGDSSFGNGAPGNDCVHFQGSNFTITNNQLQYVGMGVDNTTWSNGDANTVISNNDLQQNGWGIGCAGGAGSNSNYQIYSNHFHNYTEWNSEGTHVNGVHCFDNSGGGISSLYFYNNLMDGPMGNGGWTAWFYCEINSVTTSCLATNGSTITGSEYVFNNVIVATGTVVNGNGLFNGFAGVNSIFANNYLYGSGTSGATGTGPCLSFLGSNITMVNNVFQNCTQAYVAGPYDSLLGPSFGTVDYNIYANMTGGGNQIWQVTSSTGTNWGTSTFSTWKSNCSCDSHSQAQLGSLLSNITSEGVPSTGYIGISAGINESSSATGALSAWASDTSAGNTHTPISRPSSAAWDVGAYQLFPTYTITISSITGHGTVTSSDSVINCATGTTGTCTDTSASGTVTLTETPATGYSFSGWGGGTCTGTSSTCAVTTTATVTATFTLITYNITISSIIGKGTVTSSDSVINCTTGTTGTCVDAAASGTVTLTESPAKGYTFSGWGGGTCSGTASGCVITGAATVTAKFSSIYTVAGIGSGTGHTTMGSGSGSGFSAAGIPLYGVLPVQNWVTKVIHPVFTTTRVLGPAGGNFYQCTTGDACFQKLNQAICDWANDGVDDNWLIQIQHGTLVQTGVAHTCTQSGSVGAQSVALLPKIISGHLPTGFFVVDSDTPLPEGITVCSHATDDIGVRQPPDGDISTWWVGNNQGCDNDRPSMWTLEGNWNPGNFGMLIQSAAWDTTTNLGAANYIFRNAEFRPISTNTSQLTLVREQAPSAVATQTSQFSSNIHYENIYMHSNGTDWCSKVGGITAYWYSAKGTGYAANDTGTVTTGNGDATYIINSVSGGVPIIASIANQGSGYSIGANQATTATTGTGTGLAFNVLGTASASPSCVTSFHTGGPATTHVVTGFGLGDCNNCSVKFSYVTYIATSGGIESHGISLARSAGPDAIVHNWIEDMSAPIFAGGIANTDSLYFVNDLEIRSNRLSNPPSLVGTAYTGPSLLLKAGLELKAGNRVIVDGNIAENLDESGVQNGECYELNPRPCSAGNQCNNPQVVLQNVTMTNNICRHALTGFDISGRSGYPPNGGGVSPALRNVNVSNNLIYDQGNSSFYDHFNVLPHPYAVRLSVIGEAFICSGSRIGIVITLGCAPGPTGLSQTQIVPGDIIQIAGCDDSTWDLPGTVNGFSSGPLALNGTVPGGLTVVYNNAAAVSKTSANCVVQNSIGSPVNFNFIHNTMVMDTTINQAASGYIYDGVPTSTFSDLGCGGGPTNIVNITAAIRSSNVVTATLSSLTGYPAGLGGNQIIIEVSGVTPADFNGKAYWLGQSGGNATWLQAGPNETATAFGTAAQMHVCQGTNDFAQYANFKNNLIAPNLLTTASCPTAGTGWGGWVAQGGTNAEGCKNGFNATGCSELTLDASTSVATYADFPGRCPGQYTEMGGSHAGANPPFTLFFPNGTVCTGGPGSGNANCVGLANMMNGTFVGSDPNFNNYVLDSSSIFHNAGDDGKDFGANPFVIQQAIDNTWYTCLSFCGAGPLPDAP